MSIQPITPRALKLNANDVDSLRKLFLELSDFIQFETRIKRKHLLHCKRTDDPFKNTAKNLYSEVKDTLLKISENSNSINIDLTQLEIRMRLMLNKAYEPSFNLLTDESISFIKKFLKVNL